MDTYRTIDGKVIDLRVLSAAEREYLLDRVAAAKANVPYHEFWPTTSGGENPLIRAGGGRITAAVWNHPLYQALRDLEERLGIRQGELAADPGDALDTDPLADTWVPVAQAARQKGVVPTAIHKAIKRGDLIARPARTGGTWLVVSANSLACWQPDRQRQVAARGVGRGGRAAVPVTAA